MFLFNQLTKTIAAFLVLPSGKIISNVLDADRIVSSENLDFILLCWDTMDKQEIKNPYLAFNGLVNTSWLLTKIDDALLKLISIIYSIISAYN